MTLTELFTQIADAIRSKMGGASKIKAEDFPSVIKNISTTPKIARGQNWRQYSSSTSATVNLGASYYVYYVNIAYMQDQSNGYTITLYGNGNQIGSWSGSGTWWQNSITVNSNYSTITVSTSNSDYEHEGLFVDVVYKN